MDLATLFILHLVVQIGLGIYGFLRMPVDTGFRTDFDRWLRRTVLICAFLLCLPVVTLILQIVAIIIYTVRGATAARAEMAADSRLESSFGSGQATSPQSSTGDSPENPFDTSESDAAPFDEGDSDPGSQRTPPSDNPFG